MLTYKTNTVTLLDARSATAGAYALPEARVEPLAWAVFHEFGAALIGVARLLLTEGTSWTGCTRELVSTTFR